ncbi:MAG TPA: PAS domain-containing sensor histidine kinase [Candidatus Binatia bacterium]
MSEHDTARIDHLLSLLAQQSKEHAFVLLDANARVLWWSPGAGYIFDRSSSEMVGQPLGILFTPEDRERGIPDQEVQLAVNFGKAEDDRWQIRRDGSRFWATGILIGLRDHNRNLVGFGKILRNRTDLREQLEALRNQVQALTAANQRKDNFLATFSHELRNPLASICTTVELISRTASGNANLQRSVKLIEEQLDFVRRMLDDLLDVTRISTGKVRLNVRPVVLQEIIEKAVEAARPRVEERYQRIQVIGPRSAIVLQGDADRLHQVFSNLLSNGVKYTPERGAICVEVTIEADEAVVRVSDTGVGIPHDMLPGIFDLFTQVETQLSHGGLGIGLALVKDFVALHGGSVQVRSEGVGKGSEFTVRLPLNIQRTDAELRIS